MGITKIGKSRLALAIVLLTLALAATVWVSLTGMAQARPEQSSEELITASAPHAPVTTGVAAHGADDWIRDGHNGTDIKIGIIDIGGWDGTSNLVGTQFPPLAQLKARCHTKADETRVTSSVDDCDHTVGETNLLIHKPRSGKHGTLIGEIIHDVAPGATIYISNARSPAEIFAAADWMTGQGVKVISYSIGHLLDAPGDGNGYQTFHASEPHPMAIIDDMIARGVLWVSAVGNDGQRTWFGDFTGSKAATFDPDSDGIISFLGDQEIIGVRLLRGKPVRISIRWKDRGPAAVADAVSPHQLRAPPQPTPQWFGPASNITGAQPPYRSLTRQLTSHLLNGGVRPGPGTLTTICISIPTKGVQTATP